MELCGSGYVPIAVFFEDCINVALTTSGSSSSAPVATFAVAQSATNPFTFSFDGSSSHATAPGASIASWSWNFGDGSAAGSGKKVSYTFRASGRYTVTLTVTDTAGAQGTYSVGLDVSALVVRMSPGETNGKIFTVDVTVRNAGSSTVDDVAFADPGAITVDSAVATASSGDVVNVEGPDPALPTSLLAGQASTSTVAFVVRRQGAVDIDASVTGTSPSGASETGTTSAALHIGVRKPTSAELLRQFTDALIDASQQAGVLINSAQQRLGDLVDWATTQAKGAVLPGWLTSNIESGTIPPSSAALPGVAGWKILAARAAGLDDSALSWLPDDPTRASQLYLSMEKNIVLGGVDAFKAASLSLGTGLANAAEFYGQLSSGDSAFQASASAELQQMVNDLGVAAAKKITLIGSIIAYSSEYPIAPGSLGDFQTNPVLQNFTKDSAATIDASLKAVDASLVADVQLARTNPDLAAAEFGHAYGEFLTGAALTIATNEFGSSMLGSLSKAIQRALPEAEGSVALDASATITNPEQVAQDPGAPLIATGSRQTLESLGEETPISLHQLESLGGFYGPDAAQVQQIIKDVKAKYGVDAEIQVRPGNPASLPYYADGTGVPKPEWIKPKATEWTDLQLGAPPASLGKSTLYEPVLPSDAQMATYTEPEQAAIRARYNSQKDIYAQSFDPTGAFQKLLADSQTAQGATQVVGLGTKSITGLRYSLQEIPGHPGAYYIIDDAAGGKYVLSDADYQAVVSAGTGRAIPAADQRGAIELYVLNRLEKDTASFGGHGWTVSGFDLPSQYSKPFLQFSTGSMSPANARSTLAWWLSSQTSSPKWLTEYARELTHDVTVDDLMGLFSPGQFVIKFNGTTMRVGYGASLGK